MPTKRKQLKYLFFLTFIFLGKFLFSQSGYLNLNNEQLIRFEKDIYEVNNNNHTSIKPYSISSLNWSNDTVIQKTFNFSDSNISFINFKKNKISTSINPVLHNQLLVSLDNNKFYFEALNGIWINTDFGKKLNTEIIYAEGLGSFNGFRNSIVQEYNAVPGMGYFSPTNNGLNGRYRFFQAHISYSPSKYFNATIGNGKNFFGEGYRSLLLSDNANNNPYLRLSTNIWKLKYVNLFSNYSDTRFSDGVMSKFYNKFGAMHYLSWNITKKLNISLFESVVWESRDTTGGFNYDYTYLNPVIFYRPVEYAAGSPDRVLIGLNTSYKFNSNNILYGQISLDEFIIKEIRADVASFVKRDTTIVSGWWGNKYGLQLGFKTLNLFKIEGLRWQTEINLVRPYTYSHGSVYQSYTHFSQPLAHPLGANFYEFLSIAHYQYKSFIFRAQANYQIVGYNDGVSNYGRDIMLSYNTRPYEHGHTIGQGVRTNVLYTDFRINYLLNKKANLSVELGYTSRFLSNQIKFNEQMVYFGIKSLLFNSYFDR
jgi:hypothetical protein